MFSSAMSILADHLRDLEHFQVVEQLGEDRERIRYDPSRSVNEIFLRQILWDQKDRISDGRPSRTRREILTGQSIPPSR